MIPLALCARSAALGRPRLPAWHAIPHRPSSCRLSTASVLSQARAGGKQKPQRTVSLLSELPGWKVDADGHKAGPLEDYLDGVKPKRTRRKSPKSNPAVTPDATGAAPAEESTTGAIGAASQEPDFEEEYQAAVNAGSIPNSALAKQVFLNWKRFPDCIVLTRVGKFYESYFAPAITFSSLLSLKLAYKRYSEGSFPFSGFPIHQLDKYLKILVQDLGHTVVLVEEYDEHGNKESLDPIKKKASGGTDLKERKVGRVVTPGTLVEESWLSGDESRYLLAIAVGQDHGETPERNGEGQRLSLAYTDASTGEFFLKETTVSHMEDELVRIAPREVVLDTSLRELWDTNLSPTAEESRVEPVVKLLNLLRVLGVHVSFADHLRPPIIEGLTQIAPTTSPPTPTTPSLEHTAIALLRHHLQYALRDEMPALNDPTRQSSSSQMQIDAATLHALEVRHALRPGGMAPTDTYGAGRIGSPLSARGTLLSVLSKTMTPSGHRLLIRTLTAPSTDLGFINSRLDLVQSFVDRPYLREELKDMIRGVGDVMRIVQRFKGRRGDGRDAWEVGRWIRGVTKILDRVRSELELERGSDAGATDKSRLDEFVHAFKPLETLAQKLEESTDEAAVLRGAVEEEGDEDGMEEAGEAMIAPPGRKEGETRKEEVERKRQEREDAMWWMRPSFSSTLQGLHDQLLAHKRGRETMQAGLKEKYDVESLELVKTRATYVMTLNKKVEYAKIDKSSRFASINETGKAKTYTYNPWSALGAKTDKLIEDLVRAQRRAFDELRRVVGPAALRPEEEADADADAAQVVDHADAIQHNAELVDELDLTMSFAQVAVDNNYVRPILNNSTDLHIVNGRHPTVESSLQSTSRPFTPNTTHMGPSARLHIITGPNQGGKSTLLRQTAIIAILAQSGCFVPAQLAEIGVVDRVFSRVGARDDLYRDRSTFMLEMVETAAILRHATERSLVIMDEIGRGTTLHSGLSIAYATLDHILHQTRCRTLFATHYHELADMLSPDGRPLAGVGFWCTDVDEVDGAFAYSYRLRPGINHHSHAIKAARLAGRAAEDIRTYPRIDTGNLIPISIPIITSISINTGNSIPIPIFIFPIPIITSISINITTYISMSNKQL